MLRSIDLKREHSHSLAWRLTGIVLFTLLIALSAQVEIPFGAVPFTLQVLAVLLAGMILGARDGAAAVIAYLGLMAANLPVAAGGAGISALQGVTAGYLVGFVPAAFVAGWLVEHGANRTWQRWIAGLVGIAIIYACGVPFLKLFFDLFGSGASWQQAWAWGVAPFLMLDILKALVAAILVESGRAFLLKD